MTASEAMSDSDRGNPRVGFHGRLRKSAMAVRAGLPGEVNHFKIKVHILCTIIGKIVKTPKTVSATEFKMHCLALLEEVRETRQPILVTRHGKPVVEISPYVSKNASRVNPLKGTIVFQGDLTAPIQERWDSAP